MKIGLIGAGNMARALARGWGDPVLCCDGGSGRGQALAAELGGEALGTAAEVAARAELLVLAHKPAQLELIADEIAAGGKPVVSVLGGVSLEALRRAYPASPVIRAMPNTPAEVRRAVTCLAVPDGLDDSLVQELSALFGRLGTVLHLPESQLGAATAVTGVGPAYQALLAEAQIDAAVRYGLKPELAAQLVTETMEGSAALLAVRGYDTLEVRREVTSPGGATARGLAALERAGIRGAFLDAIDALAQWERGA